MTGTYLKQESEALPAPPVRQEKKPRLLSRAPSREDGPLSKGKSEERLSNSVNDIGEFEHRFSSKSSVRE